MSGMSGKKKPEYYGTPDLKPGEATWEEHTAAILAQLDQNHFPNMRQALHSAAAGDHTKPPYNTLQAFHTAFEGTAGNFLLQYLEQAFKVVVDDLLNNKQQKDDAFDREKTMLDILSTQKGELEFQTRLAESLKETIKGMSGSSRKSLAKDPEPFAASDKDSAEKKCEKFKNWKQKIVIRWTQDDHQFPTEFQKILHAAGLLEGTAYRGIANAINFIVNNSTNQASWQWPTGEAMLEELTGKYEVVDTAVKAEGEMELLHQSKFKAYSDFITKFIELSDMLSMDDAEKVRKLKKKLNDNLRSAIRVQVDQPEPNNWPKWLKMINKLASNEEAADYEEKARKAFGNIGGNKASNNGSNNNGNGGSGATTSQGGDAMDIDKLSINGISNKEKRRRLEKQLCLNCGEDGHFARDCPKQGGGAHRGNHGGGGPRGGGRGRGYDGGYNGGGRGQGNDWYGRGGYGQGGDSQYNDYGGGRSRGKFGNSYGGGYGSNNYGQYGRGNGRGGPYGSQPPGRGGRQDLRATHFDEHPGGHSGYYGEMSYNHHQPGFNDHTPGSFYPDQETGRVTGEFDDNGDYHSFNGESSSSGNARLPR